MKINALRRSLALVAGLIMVATSVAACGESTSGGSDSKTFTLPVIDSSSGPGAANGKSNIYAYKLAAKEINQAGGIDGRRLVLKFYDDQSSPSAGVQQLRKIPPSSLAVGGPGLSSVAAGVDVAVKSLKLPAVSGSVSDGDIVAAGQPWSFSTVPPYQYTLPTMTKDWIQMQKLTGRRVALLYDDVNAATQGQGQLMQKVAEEAGVDVSKTIHTQTGQPSYSSQVAQVAAIKPDAVMACALSADGASMVKQMRSAGVNGPILLCPATTNPTFPSLLGDQVTDVTLAWNWWPTLPGNDNQKFTHAYKAESGGQAPSSSAPSSYEAIKLIAQAVAATKVLSAGGSVPDNREKIRDYIADVKDFHGVNGAKSMGPKGTMEQAGVLMSYDKGQIREIAK
jgi:branched-chain amino acid transport system substrate-binding protein